MKIKIVIFVTTLVSALALFGYLETFRVGVTHVTIHDKRLSDVLYGKTLVHISDVHLQSIGTRERKVLDLLDHLNPDIIVLTGDYIRWKGNVPAALEFMAKLKAHIGVYGVTGDYEYSNSRKSCLFCHQQGSGAMTKAHSVHMLENTKESLVINGRPLSIIGMDYANKDEDIHEKFKSVFSKKEAVIVLSHNPLNFDDFDRNTSMLMLAGDTHGGQIPLPSVAWNLLGYKKNARYNQGLFIDGEKKMYVTRGVGFSHIPFRFFCPPEIVVYHFEE